MFRLNLEANLLSLCEDLKSGTYKCDAYHVFNICDPKIRVIAAPSYRDRVVHHALCAVIEPIFDVGFDYDSYACRKGKGTHAAMTRLSQLLSSKDYVFQGDISKFFPSINHAVLKLLIRQRVKCKLTLVLCDRIIDSACTLSNGAGKGLPIGNLTSQLFANIYLHALDQFIRRRLPQLKYIRYCDDFILISLSKETLAVARSKIEVFLKSVLLLDLHAHKRRIYPAGEGISFLGFRHFAGGARRLLPANGHRFARRLRSINLKVSRGELSPPQATRRVESWRSHASHGHTSALQHALLSGNASEWALGITARGSGRFLEQQ